MTSPVISIVLPTRNGRSTLPALLNAIDRQRIDLPFEIVVVDSESTDGSLDLLRTRVQKLLQIKAASFNHGLTRNLAIEEARGELIVLLVQDALPASDTWLTNLTRPLFADSRLAGTFARQIPTPDAGAITRHYLSRWQAASTASREFAVADPDEIASLSPAARLDRCTFDNVCSCIRRSVWKDHPFRATPIAEDLEWAREVLLAGYRLAYVAEAIVIHSHERPAKYEFQRTYLLHNRLHALFGLRTIPTITSLARSIASSLALHLNCRKEGGSGQPVSIPRAVGLAFAWPLGQYFGGLSAARGWKVPRFQV